MLRLFGIGLTLAVIGLDAAKVLAPLERWMYDKRAALFQDFTPPPTSELVHVDIDDGALETVGYWPWPRSTLAEIVTELHRAGAKAIALDIVFSEPQPQQDTRFAEAIRNAGNVLVPMSFEFERQAWLTPTQQQVSSLLGSDLELNLDDVCEQLGRRGNSITESDFFLGRAQAVKERVDRERMETCRSLAELKSRILPRTQSRNGAPLTRIVENAWKRVEIEHSLARFGAPAAKMTRSLLAPASSMRPLVPELAAASTYSGYVDLLSPADSGGVVRSVPLWIEYQGRRYPQMALALACAALSVDPANIRLQDDGMYIPRRVQPDLFVPLRKAPTEKFGVIGYFFDIPWFGGDRWQTMYDVVAHRRAVQHLPITLAWSIGDARKKMVRNNELADEAMQFIDSRFGYIESAKPFLKNRSSVDECPRRAKVIKAALAELQPLLTAFDGVKWEELKDDERQLLNAVDVLRAADRENSETSQRLELKTSELREALHGKTVLVGWTATGNTDMYQTPLHVSCPGVVVHGAIFNGMLTGDFLRKAPLWVDSLITLCVGLLTTMIVGWLDPWKALLLSALLLFSYMGLNGATLFDYGNWIVGCAGPVVAGGVVWAGLTLTRFIGEAKERGRITQRFGSYADANLVRYVVDHPEMDVFEGQVRELTVVFTDLAGFTTLTEKLREKAVPILSDYMSRMVPVVQEHHGLVNKFLGDGIMFFYGAPMPNADHAADAVATVLKMTNVLEQFNRELADAGNPNVAMRAGISTGPMVVGDAGSRVRSDYTVLGDAVNLGARLESANKAVGTSILLSGRTVELLGERFLVRPIGKLRVAGKTEGVMTFEPLALAGEATPAQHDLAQLSREMVGAYLAASFADCIAGCDRLDARFGESKLTKLYRELSAEHAGEPRVEFDGVITLKDK